MTQHLIKHISLWSLEDLSLTLFILDLSVHYVNYLIFVPKKSLQLLNSIDFLSDGDTEVIESFNQHLLIVGQSFDIFFISFNVPVQVFDLFNLQFDLLV